MDLENLDWKKIIGTLAPAVASAIGTPAAGAAVAVLSNVIFGRPDATTEDVVKSIAGGTLSAETIIAIRQADTDFKKAMLQTGLDLERIEAETEAAYLKDRQDARARQIATGDDMPQRLFYWLLLVYVLEFGIFITVGIPQDEFVRALVTRAFATIETGLASAIAYFIGSSRGSKQSGDAVRKIAEKFSFR